jgi:hypothetical protein
MTTDFSCHENLSDSAGARDWKFISRFCRRISSSCLLIHSAVPQAPDLFHFDLVDPDAFPVSNFAA